MPIHKLSVGSDTVAFRRMGGAGGRPVVLIHGNSCSSRSFERQLESSLGQQYRLVAFDLPGHGDSSKAADAAGTYSLTGYSKTLLAFIAELRLQRAVFVGWSLGGHILLQAADRLPDASGILIFGTPPLTRPFVPQTCFLPHPCGSLLFQEALSDADVKSFAAAFLRPSETEVPQVFKDDIRRTDPTARTHLLSSLLAIQYRDEVDILQRIECPVAVLHGEHDQLVRYDYLLSLSLPGLWRGAPQVIPGAGHAPQWESPQAFNELLEAFLQDCFTEPAF